MKAQIERAASVLTGRSLWTFRRTADLAVFQFGEKRQVKTFHGETVEVGEYALHIQCAWRLSQGDRVITGNGDLYDPVVIQSGKSDPNFDWKKQPTRVDELMQSLFENGTRQFIVQRVEVGVAASLCIHLEREFILQIFPNYSGSDEYWRFLKPGKDEPHFVVTGNGIEI
jgi:hypothetical protein